MIVFVPATETSSTPVRTIVAPVVAAVIVVTLAAVRAASIAVTVAARVLAGVRATDTRVPAVPALKLNEPEIKVPDAVAVRVRVEALDRVDVTIAEVKAIVDVTVKPP
jgi:hypothetical protein